MNHIWQHLAEAMGRREDVALAVTAERMGSAPRGVGAYMIVGEQGLLHGSIGGGMLEYEAVSRAKTLLQQKESCLEQYDLSEGDMVCGGKVAVLFRCFLWSREEDCAFAKAAAELSRRGACFGILLPTQGAARVTEPFSGSRQQLEIQTGGAAIYRERILFGGRVWIFGGGHLARELVPVLSRVGFRCMVMDDRAEYAIPEDFPDAQAVKQVDFSAPDVPVQPQDFLIIATRGHQGDAECIRFGLKTRAGFIGLVGSRKKADSIRARMRSEGFTAEDANRIVTPVGLDIGSETPAEIAVSIAAQLIGLRAQRER